MEKISNFVAGVRKLAPLIQIALALAVTFGVVAPEKATIIRNDVLAPLGVAQAAGDLL